MNESERLADIEARLIAQEHRLFSVLQNFFVERPKWPQGDPRRDAAAKALLWCIFFSPGTVALTGGTVGLATLIVLIWQTTQIREQNNLFQTQVDQQQAQLESQNHIYDKTQRTNALEMIYGTSPPPVKSEAVRPLALIQRNLAFKFLKQPSLRFLQTINAWTCIKLTCETSE